MVENIIPSKLVLIKKGDMMQLSDIVEKLSEKFYSDIKAINDKEAHFVVNDKFCITLEEQEDGSRFYLYGVIGLIDPNEECLIFSKALEANLFGRGTGSASIGFDKQSRSLIMFQSFEKTVDFKTFYKEFSLFLNLFGQWQEYCDDCLVEPLEKR